MDQSECGKMKRRRKNTHHDSLTSIRHRCASELREWGKVKRSKWDTRHENYSFHSSVQGDLQCIHVFMTRHTHSHIQIAVLLVSRLPTRFFFVSYSFSFSYSHKTGDNDYECGTFPCSISQLLVFFISAFAGVIWLFVCSRTLTRALTFLTSFLIKWMKLVRSPLEVLQLLLRCASSSSNNFFHFSLFFVCYSLPCVLYVADTQRWKGWWLRWFQCRQVLLLKWWKNDESCTLLCWIDAFALLVDDNDTIKMRKAHAFHFLNPHGKKGKLFVCACACASIDVPKANEHTHKHQQEQTYYPLGSTRPNRCRTSNWESNERRWQKK